MASALNKKRAQNRLKRCLEPFELIFDKPISEINMPKPTGPPKDISAEQVLQIARDHNKHRQKLAKKSEVTKQDDHRVCELRQIQDLGIRVLTAYSKEGGAFFLRIAERLDKAVNNYARVFQDNEMRDKLKGLTASHEKSQLEIINTHGDWFDPMEIQPHAAQIEAAKELMPPPPPPRKGKKRSRKAS